MTGSSSMALAAHGQRRDVVDFSARPTGATASKAIKCPWNLADRAACSRLVADEGKVRMRRLQNRLTLIDIIAAVVVELAVVGFGVFQHRDSSTAAWMSSGMNQPRGIVLRVLGFFPIAICSLALLACSAILTRDEGWRLHQILCYSAMGTVTGTLAGLLGIGGGLIFAPFFLGMGIEPAVAVATSSTCVLFTSSSTMLQYFFSDRIIVTLALVYGLVSVVASYLGTSFVHHLQDHYFGRRSYISMTVGVGVLCSALLAIGKLIAVAGR